MNRYCISLTVLVCATSIITGCASQPTRTTVTFLPDTHLIFNPEWTGMTTVDTLRSTWPSTTVFNTSAEEIEYRATTIDIQGQNGFNSDRTYRRFQSTRTGIRVR